MRTLTHYEVAWNMPKAGATMQQITVVIGKDRSTAYRWFAKTSKLLHWL